MSSTPIELMPTLSLCGEFERAMSAINDATDHDDVGVRAYHALSVWEELRERGVTLDTSQARD